MSGSHSLKSLLAALALAVPPGAVLAGEINAENGIAIKGYDPVAYFSDNAPVAGRPEFSASYKGATFQFASAAHKAQFEADPAKYAPQYGGFCAFATAAGHKALVDPAAFTVVKGKLYLNYSTQVRARWQQDVPGYIGKANAAWPQVVKQDDP